MTCDNVHSRRSGSLRAFGYSLAALFLLLALYLASSGPMGAILTNPVSDRSYWIWNTFYHAPLGKLPRPCVRLVNRYLAYCDQLYRQWNRRK